MLKTVTLFKWEHDAFTRLINNGTLPKPSMYFTTGPVHLGKEGEDEILQDVYFHTFDADNGNEELMKFFEAIAKIANEKCSMILLGKSFAYDRDYCQFKIIRSNQDGSVETVRVCDYYEVMTAFLVIQSV